MVNEYDLSTTAFMNDLQERLNKESLRTQFKTQKFGGLNREEVTEYILYIEEKLKKLEKEVNIERTRNSSFQRKLDEEIALNHSLEKSFKDNSIQTASDSPSQSLKESVAAEILLLNNRLKKVGEENRILKTQNSELQENFSSSTAKYDQLKDAFESLKDKLESEIHQKEEIKITTQGYKKRILELEQILLLKDSVIQELQLTIEQTEQENEKLLSELMAASAQPPEKQYHIGLLNTTTVVTKIEYESESETAPVPIEATGQEKPFLESTDNRVLNRITDMLTENNSKDTAELMVGYLKKKYGRRC